MKPKRNEWGGQDFCGHHGFARWIREDTDRVVYFFTTGMVLVWVIRFSAEAPLHLFDRVLEAAKEQANPPKGIVPKKMSAADHNKFPKGRW
jgi:hypothetical protein